MGSFSAAAGRGFQPLRHLTKQMGEPSTKRQAFLRSKPVITVANPLIQA